MLVLLAVGPQLHAVALGNHQRDLQDVDRIQSESLAIERSIRIDLPWGDVQIEGGDNQVATSALRPGSPAAAWGWRRGETLSDMGLSGTRPVCNCCPLYKATHGAR